jgi:hypothetical protein
LYFFLSRNLKIARARAWDQTVASRHKGNDFWQPYVEEWDNPPAVDEDKWAALAVARGRVMSFFFKQGQCIRYLTFCTISLFSHVNGYSFRHTGWWYVYIGLFQSTGYCKLFASTLFRSQEDD